MKEFNEIENINYILQDFLDLLREKCNNCNKSRVECAFQPHCENRKYMNTQVHLKVDPNDLPAFCYSQQVRNINDYLNKKPFLIEPVDYKIFLSDFNELLKIKTRFDPKNFDKLGKEITRKISNLKGKTYNIQTKEDSKNYFMLIADGIIYFIDLKKEIVTVNLKNKALETEHELSDIINLYSQYYDIKIEIIEEMTGWWYLKASFPSKKVKSDDILKEYKEKIEKFSEYVHYYIDSDTIHFLIDIKTPLNNKWKDFKFSASKIHEIFKLLNEISKKVS